MDIKMSELRFKDIIDSLAESYDPVLREELFAKLEALKTEDDSLRGVQLFVQKHGRDYELMRNTFKSFNELLDSKEQQANKIKLSWVKYAAVLLALVAFGFYYYANKSLDLTDYEYQDAGLPVLMGSASDLNFNNGMSALKLKEYSKAYNAFSKCNRSDTVIFYQGMSAYAAGNYEKALYHLNEIPTESIYYGKSLYLNSLCNLHLGKIEDAKLTLQVVLLTQPDFSVKAAELLEKLK